MKAPARARHRANEAMLGGRRTEPRRQPQLGQPLLRLWLLRMLIPLGGYRQLFEGPFCHLTLAQALELEHWLDSERDDDPAVLLAELRRLHEQVEEHGAQWQVPEALARNSERLGDLIGLNEVDIRLLQFAVLLHSERLLDDTADWLGELSTARVFYVLAELLDLPEDDVKRALSTRGLLTQSGLVVVDRGCTTYLRGKLDLLSSNFADHMLSEGEDLLDLLRDTVTRASTAQLVLNDFRHIDESLAVLLPYLRQTLDEHRVGVNIFIYGQPGTGKSQLARVLAAELACELFEIASEDEDGDPVQGQRRLRAFGAAQRIFSRRCALLLFDEIEDVFNDGSPLAGVPSTAQGRKAWMNRMLESNPVPVLWLSNEAECLDPAFIRRFDLVIELDIPPQKQRERIVSDACADLLPPASIRRIAAAPTLAPAVIARAAGVVRRVRSHLDDDTLPRAVEKLVQNTLKAQGYGPLPASNSPIDDYDPAFISADVDLNEVTEGVARERSARLCLYGPPGTGKSAFGYWLARQLGAELQLCRASELLGMYLGETEQNIADAFERAEQSHAVLMFDEIDGFLQDRRNAQRSWEVTQVNEMLTRMESFNGVFIASTNIMRGLDPASLRRFDLKVRFDYLKPQQALTLFRRHCERNAWVISTSVEEDFLRLHVLTPGDFAAVIRQSRFRPLDGPAALLAALRAECHLKEDGRRGEMGFFN